MKNKIKHIVLAILMVMMVAGSTAQVKKRYVEQGSLHALSVPDNPDYRFEWSIKYGLNSSRTIPVTSDSARTQNIRWNELTTYHVSVIPVLDSVKCYGEYVYLDVVVVEYLSLHTFDDVYYTTIDTPVSGDVSQNDFDDTGADIYYTSVPVVEPKHGEVELMPDGTFTYTPNEGFIGIDEFVYEAYNSNDDPMYSNSRVTIVVQDDREKADLFIAKTGPEKALRGGEIKYKIVVRNDGPDVAINVAIRDTLAFGLFTPDYAIGNEPFRTWNDSIMLESLAVGDSVQIVLRADISPFSPNMVYNQALTWSDTFDPEYIDNDSIWPTEILDIYVDLPGQIYVSSCESDTLPGDFSNSNYEITSYRWTTIDGNDPVGLSNPFIANPVFTPDPSNYGTSVRYVLTIVDERGNDATDTLTVFVAEEPIALIEADTLYMDKNSDFTIGAGLSSGESIEYWWDTDGGNFISDRDLDSVSVNTIGKYYLTITDRFGCEARDSVYVFWQSYPPEALRDSVSIVAGSSIVLPGYGNPYLNLAATPDAQKAYFEALPDSNVNVLRNDYDRNDFNIEVSDIATPPSSGLIAYSWDSTGQFVITPDADFWGVDSLEYRVCNDGIPVKCSTAWLYIRSLRQPLNADVEIVKTGKNINSNGYDIAFWEDTIRYELMITNHGPDTTNLVKITDIIANDFHNPQYSIDGGQTWEKWLDTYALTGNFIPDDTLRVDVKAFVRSVADRFVDNTAYIETDIVENDLQNDTSTVQTKIKELVEAVVFQDTILLGSCIDTVSLDGSQSTGEGITYSWTPVNHSFSYLQSGTADDSIAVFENPGRAGFFTYKLTVTDDDFVTASGNITVQVLEAPVARVGREYYEIAIDDTTGISLNGTPSTGVGLHYYWSTTDGEIAAGTGDDSPRAIAMQTGTYKLVVVDIAGCKDSTTVPVHQYYYPPFAIPDYYSMNYTDPNFSMNGDNNLLYNDFDPNEIYYNKSFNLSIVPINNMTTAEGGRVTIYSNGNFTYVPRSGMRNEVDYFTYTLINDATPQKSDRGYVYITVGRSSTAISNLTIDKEVVSGYEEAIVGKPDDVQFKMTITNEGPDRATEVLFIDSLSQYLGNASIYRNGVRNPQPFKGQLDLGDINVGQTINLEIRATALPGGPPYVFNAAMVNSVVYDDKFVWDDVPNRNVDTASVVITSDLVAVARLVELFDNDRADGNIGHCDNLSYLTAEDSRSFSEIDGWSWAPTSYFKDETYNEEQAYFNMDAIPDNDTTITFTLQVGINDWAESDIAYIDVHFSPKVIADAGPDRKMNEGESLYIEEAVAVGAEATIEWMDVERGQPLTSFNEGNILQPIIDQTGQYRLTVTDKHGCVEEDIVIVKENGLYLVDDIINVVIGDTLVGNVATNDFDPDGDSIFYNGVANGPAAQYLLEDPMNSGILKSTNANNVIGEDGSFVFIAPAGFTGYTSFTYEGRDNNVPSLSKTATVHIRVIDIDETNTPPVINADAIFSDGSSKEIEFNVLANDYDPDGGLLTLNEITEQPTQGTVDMDPDGTIRYTPALNAKGTDEFTYSACDNGIPSACETAKVTVYLNKLADENHRPVAADDAFYAVGHAISGNILANDYDPDGDYIALILDAVEGPYHGTFIEGPSRDGSFTYLPDEGFEGTDQIVYQILETDTDEELGDFATIYIVSLDESRYKTDVSITKSTTGADEVISGTTIEYELLVKAEGPTLANDVVFIDTLASELSNVQFSSDNGLSWSNWDGSFTVDQLMLYEESSILVRAQIPDVFAGDLVNTAYVDHAMTETEPANNVSTITTGVFQRVIANAGNDTIIGACAAQTYMLDASASLGMGQMTYQWYPVKYVANPSGKQTNIIMEPLDEVEFMLVVSGSAGNVSDKDTAYVTVMVDIAPVAEAGDDQWPQDGSPVILDGSSSTAVGGEMTYSWWVYTENGEVKEISTDVQIQVNTSNDYYLTITDKYGCTSTDMVHVGYPVEEFVAVDDVISTLQQEPVDIHILDNDIIDPSDEYNLDLLIIMDQPEHGQLVINPQDSSITYIPDDYYFGPDTFVYQISTKYFTDDAQVIIHVVQKPPIVPEGFSPNGDGINDFMLIGNIELYPGNKFTVFNRWGNIVYEAEPYTNDDAWNGVANKGVRIGSGALPTGVYLYILDLGDDERLKQKIYKGNIYIATDNRR
ncbi:MAG: tandem-95 repeat protein [Prolixibacteraceae bacterium]|nr:tandem-95 repeat protein [Prolixibacteraceae bacterium]